MITKEKDSDNMIPDDLSSNKKDFTLIKTSEHKDVLQQKLLTADIFEKTKNVNLKDLISEAKDIEITLDFITYGNNLVKKILSKVLPKF